MDSTDTDVNNQEFVDYSHNVDLQDTGRRGSGWVLGVGAVVGVMILIALISSLLGGSSNKKPAALKVKPAPPTVIAQRGGTATTTTAVPLSDASTVVAITSAINGGFTAWGSYAADGNLGHLGSFFDSKGPQWTQFQHDAKSTTGKKFTFHADQITVQPGGSDSQRDVLVQVSVDQEGASTRKFQWKIDMHLSNHWKIWQITNV